MVFLRGKMLSEIKVCSRCHSPKPSSDFYVCKGFPRRECKSCTIKKNGVYQHKKKPWRSESVDKDAKREYMKKYYREHKEKYLVYRAAFAAKHPDYQKMYQRDFIDLQRNKKTLKATSPQGTYPKDI